MARDDLTAEYVRELFHYDAEKGQLWRHRKWRSCLVDTVHRSGYRTVTIDVKQYLAHRIVWLWTYGCWPTHEIDHINGVKTDNRLGNLREVTRALNAQNKRAASAWGASGYLGVTRRANRARPWEASIELGGKSVYLGRYPTPEEAHEAYITAKRSFHPGCTI